MLRAAGVVVCEQSADRCSNCLISPAHRNRGKDQGRAIRCTIHHPSRLRTRRTNRFTILRAIPRTSRNSRSGIRHQRPEATRLRAIPCHSYRAEHEARPPYRQDKPRRGRLSRLNYVLVGIFIRIRLADAKFLAP
jgi:hypothetical protein